MQEIGRWGLAIASQGLTSYGFALFTRQLGMSTEEATEICDGAFVELRRRDVHTYFALYVLIRSVQLGSTNMSVDGSSKEQNPRMRNQLAILGSDGGQRTRRDLVMQLGSLGAQVEECAVVMTPPPSVGEGIMTTRNCNLKFVPLNELSLHAVDLCKILLGVQLPF